MKIGRIFFWGLVLFLGGLLAFNRLPYFQGTVDELALPLLKVDPGQVSNISIRTPDGEEFLFSKIDAQWMLSCSQWSNKISPSLMHAMTSSLQGVYSLGVVGQNEESWTQFNLDNNRAREIKIYDQSRVIETFYLSQAPKKDSLKQVGTYLRFSGSNIVYEVTAQLGATYFKDFQFFRTRTIFDFDPFIVRTVRFIYAGLEQWNLQRMDSLWQFTQTGYSGNVHAKSWLDSLSQLKGETFADRFSELDAERSKVANLDFYLENQDKLSLNIFRDSSQSSIPFVLQSNQFPKRFYQCDSSWVQFLTSIPLN